MEPIRIPHGKQRSGSVEASAVIVCGVTGFLLGWQSGMFGVTGALLPYLLLFIVVNLAYARYAFWMHRRRRDPALLIDAEGVTDNTNLLPGGLVRWQEIARLEETQLGGQPALLLHLYDPEAYMERLPG